MLFTTDIEAIAGEVMADFPYETWLALPVGKQAWALETEYERKIQERTGCEAYFARLLWCRWIGARSKNKKAPG